ncbi:MAG: DUF3014 domain-containing protein [Acidobacteria bacterium]|nr:DUF3014 domain-containing protein [Acidobacteriota bacterium]
MNRTVGIAAGILVLVVGVAWWFLSSGSQPEPVVEPVPEVAAPVVEAPAEPVEELPDIGESDALTRDLAAGFGMYGVLAERLLGQEELVSRFVRVTDAVATGGSLERDLGLLAPSSAFDARRDGERFFVDPNSYARYDAVGEAIASIDAEAAAAAFRRIEPLADEVYTEIVGQPSEFRPVLVRALRVLLDVPVVLDPPELIDAINRYEYADESLERLTLPQKHLLRTGPANVGRIQARLRQLQRLLS